MHLSLAMEAPGPDPAGRRFGKEDVLPVLALCCLCLALFFFRLGAMPLWDVDEGMHAATSKDMVLTGDWITPKVNGKNFYDKTALFNWMVAASFEAFGFTEFAARLPAAVLGLATVLLTFLFGTYLFGRGPGFMAGAVLATSPEFIVLSRSVVHDISLAFFITATLFFFYRAYSAGSPKRSDLVLFYISAGFGVLAKGPIGIVLPGLAIFVFLLLRRRLDFLKEMKPGWGALIFLAVAAPWYVLISLRNADYVSYFVMHQNIGNFLSKVQARHPEPLYYYVPALLGGMLPWSFFIPVAVTYPLSAGIRKINDAELFLICWFGMIFLFFSAAHSKLATYLLPSYPGYALLIGALWHRLAAEAPSGLRKGFAWSLAALLALLVAASAYIAIKKPQAAKLQTMYGTSLNDLIGILVVLAAILFAALMLFLFRQYRSSFVALAATFGIGFLVMMTVYIPHMNPYRSTKALAIKMDALLPSGAPLVMYWNMWESPLFYTNRRAIVLYTEKQLLDYLGSEKTTLCIIDRQLYAALPDVISKSKIIAEEGNKLLIAGKNR
jgi:4-amino-4-deoxy-L-arabinose transferase-like glycosyltransferase